MANHV
ncbi:hypothetical protein D043_1913A, partial [Vibrio parahaemolyticus EKP-021]